MAVRLQCPNPDCLASWSIAEAEPGRPLRCGKCGSVLELSTPQAGEGAATGGPGPSWGRPADLSPGTLFGNRYEIRRLLGRGGMGVVYLAFDRQLARDVALKIPLILPEDEDDSELFRRFTREARAAARLDHPNICPIYDVGQVDGIHYLTMAYIEGRPLTSLLADGPLPGRRAAEVVLTLARALEEAHRAGIVHRDLKPSNILVSSRRGLVIMDFGLARGLKGDESQITQSGQMLGTPGYMAPEQVRGDVAAMGPGCDVFSLGVILYELLAGRRPFVGKMAEVLTKLLTEEPEPLSRVRPGVHPRLEAVCLRAMAKSPAERFATMADFAAALEEILGDGPGPPEQPVVPAVPARPTAAPPRRWRAAAFAVVATAGLLVVIALSVRPVLRRVSPPPVAAPSVVVDPPATLPEAPPAATAPTGKTPPPSAGEVATTAPPAPPSSPPPSGVTQVGGEASKGAKATETRETAGAGATLAAGPKPPATPQPANAGASPPASPEPPPVMTPPNAAPAPIAVTPPSTGAEPTKEAPPVGPSPLPSPSQTRPAVAVAPTPAPSAETQPAPAPAPAPLMTGAAGAEKPPPSPPVPLVAPGRVLPPPAPGSSRTSSPGGVPRPATDVLPARLRNKLGMTLVRIDPGTFEMGTSDAQLAALRRFFPSAKSDLFTRERPTRRVRITRPIYLGEHEVTVRQFRQFVERSGYRTEAEKDGRGGAMWDESRPGWVQNRKYTWRDPGFPQGDDCPVVQVSWNDASAMVAWLNETAGGSLRYRLPSEAEWEYAARAGTSTLFPSGDDPESLAAIGNVADASVRKRYPRWQALRGDDGHAYTAPAGSFRAGPTGLYDMIGNVSEWCLDGHAPDPARGVGHDDSSPQPAPGRATLRAARGGGWATSARGARAAARSFYPADYRNANLGFRVVAERPK